MPDTFSLGPFVLPTLRVGTLLAFFIASWLAPRFATRLGLDSGWSATTAELSILVGILGARLGFVLQTYSAYADAPWSALYLWQPGYALTWGIAAGLAFGAYRVLQRPASIRLNTAKSLAASFGISLGLVGLLLGGGQVSLDSNTLQVGDSVPDISLYTLDGLPVRLSDTEGPVVLNFWATWCSPCRRELPLLERASMRYEQQGVSVVGISVGESVATVSEFVEDLDLSYALWLDSPAAAPDTDNSQTVFNAFGGRGLPLTVFIDASGVIRARQVGELSSGILARNIDRLIEVADGSAALP